MKLHTYTNLYRPPDFCTLPKGWRLVERPAGGFGYDRRLDLPVSSKTFGVVGYTEPLDAGQIESYQLQALGTVDFTETA